MVGYIVIIITFLFRAFTDVVQADTYQPSYSASPSASPANCSLSITSGNNALAPRNVTFQITPSSYKYSFDFGDGESEISSNSITHHYSQAGTYSVTASSSTASCSTTVTLKSPPITPHVSECTGITLTSGSAIIASTSTTLRVKGYDNKGQISAYRLDFGEHIFDSITQDIIVNIATPGSYPVKAYIKDSTGVYVGGEAKCDTSFLVKSAFMQTQPDTGPSTWFLISAVGLLLISFLKLPYLSIKVK